MGEASTSRLMTATALIALGTGLGGPAGALADQPARDSAPAHIVKPAGQLAEGSSPVHDSVRRLAEAYHARAADAEARGAELEAMMLRRLGDAKQRIADAHEADNEPLAEAAAATYGALRAEYDAMVAAGACAPLGDVTALKQGMAETSPPDIEPVTAGQPSAEALENHRIHTAEARALYRQAESAHDLSCQLAEPERGVALEAAALYRQAGDLQLTIARAFLDDDWAAEEAARGALETVTDRLTVVESQLETLGATIN